MEVVRKYINASSLMSIMKLPENFKNRKLEVIVLPTEEKETVEKEVDVQSAVQSLVGIIPYTDISLSELREERLSLLMLAGESFGFALARGISVLVISCPCALAHSIRQNLL